MFSASFTADDWQRRGGRPVAALDDMSLVERRFVLAFRQACTTASEGGSDQPSGEVATFCGLILRHARRAVMFHDPACRCVGADEACLAGFVDAAGAGASEDAALLGALILRPEMALSLVPQAAGIARCLLRPSYKRQSPMATLTH